MQSPKQSFALLSLVALISLGSSQMASAASYNFTILENLGGAGSGAIDINNAGVVVGYAGSKAASWHNGVLTQLPTDGKGGTAFGINNQGVIVGSVTTTEGKPSQAATWKNGALNVFGNTLTDNFSSAYSINDAGQIAGSYVDDYENNIYRSFKIENDQFQALPSLFGRGSSTFTSAINSSGTVVGQSQDTQSVHATIWQNNMPSELASQGNYSVANGINDAGVVVGAIDIYAAIWNDGTPTYIHGAGSVANDINSKGQIVGRSVDLNATLWDNGNAISLSSLVDPSILGNWLLLDALAINDNGDIVGQARERGSDPRTSFAFLLTLNTENPPPPDISNVPLPASLPLMMTGLGALGVMIRRKK